jgi:hypothetical protein
LNVIVWPVFPLYGPPGSENKAASTTSFKTEDALGAELLSPKYLAVMACVPGASVLVRVADPPLKTADPIPKLTLPVGVFGPAEVTVAVYFTACPKSVGFKLETSFVVVGYLFTSCVTVLELVANLVSPA